LSTAHALLEASPGLRIALLKASGGHHGRRRDRAVDGGAVGYDGPACEPVWNTGQRAATQVVAMLTAASA